MAAPGYRGYIASRPIDGERAPQHIQNLAVRDYARRKGLTFLLSAAEYSMPECYLVLEQVLDELPSLGGVICYSLFMLPQDGEYRARIWRRILGAGKSIHGALEGLGISTDADVSRIEDMWLVRRVLPRCPLEIPFKL